jgi:hypothetical protein
MAAIRYWKRGAGVVLNLETKEHWKAFARCMPQKYEWQGRHQVEVPPGAAAIVLSALVQDGQAIQEVHYARP